MGIQCSHEPAQHAPIFAGGPVQQERGFIIHNKGTDNWESSIPISETTYLTCSRDIFEAIADGQGPDKYLIALGYAGWGEGQLEDEIIHNAWLNTPFEEVILYQTPVAQRWNNAAKLLGVDINLLTAPAGHG